MTRYHTVRHALPHSVDTLQKKSPDRIAGAKQREAEKKMKTSASIYSTDKRMSRNFSTNPQKKDRK